MSMVYNELNVVQAQNTYEIRVPLGFVTSILVMPLDGQLISDSWLIDLVTKALAIRWGVAKKKSDSKKENDISDAKINSIEENNYIGTAYFSYLSVQQIESNQYTIYLPSCEQVAYIFMPPDGDYPKDRKVLRGVCKCLAKRYGLIP